MTIPNRRAVNVIAYLRSKMGKNKADPIMNYLLYFVDFNYYHKYEETIMGLTYYKDNKGETIVKPTLDYKEDDSIPFNEKELEIIDGVVEFFKDKTLEEIRAFTEKDVPILAREDDEPIDYRSVFYRVPSEVLSEDEEVFHMYRIKYMINS